MTQDRSRSSKAAPARRRDDLEHELASLREESRRLLERAARYRNFIEFSSEGIWCFAIEPPMEADEPVDAIVQAGFERGVMVECNDSLARMYGYERREDLLGTSLSDFLSPRKEENLEYMRAFVRSGFRLEDGESQELDRDGNVKYFLNNLIGIIEGGKVRQLWGTQRDITERRHLEEQLRQAQKMEAVGQIAGGVAHDFNNMLTVIAGSLELLGDEARDEERFLGPLQDANRAVDQATALTRQLLTFSRRHVVQRTTVDLNEVVTDVARMMRRVVRESIEVETRTTADLPAVLGDRVELDQALVNLVLNARDAVGDRGRVTLETSVVEGDGGRQVQVRVSDTGHGMNPELAERIFEPFFTTKGAGSGTGLGLSMVYAAVTRCDGTIRVESEPGRGTTFRIRLPAADEADRSDSRARVARAESALCATILVVEDQADVRNLVTRILESAGHEVLGATGPEHALRLAREHPGDIDLLLSDVVMPGQNGLELARALRRERPGLRVMFMTGYADLPEELGRELLREARILPKPFTRAHLQREVQTALAGWAPGVLMPR
jgi:two-component system, cell cycle sensor histidine kinase and response regulator CckA